MSSTKQHWNRAASSDPERASAPWLAAGADFGASAEPELVDLAVWLALDVPGGSVGLDIGGGAGRMGFALHWRLSRLIEADISSVMLDSAREHLAGAHNVDYLELPGDGSIPLPDASVGFVFSAHTMEHVPDAPTQIRYLTEAIRVSTPGASIAMQYPRPPRDPRRGRWGRSRHQEVATVEQLRAVRPGRTRMAFYMLDPSSMWVVLHTPGSGLS